MIGIHLVYSGNDSKIPCLEKADGLLSFCRPNNYINQSRFAILNY